VISIAWRNGRSNPHSAWTVPRFGCCPSTRVVREPAAPGRYNQLVTQIMLNLPEDVAEGLAGKWRDPFDCLQRQLIGQERLFVGR